MSEEDGSNTLFRRRVSLVISAPVKGFAENGVLVVEITELRVSFKVKKTSGKTPNTAEVTIVNLNAERRAQLQEKGGKFSLQAGYSNLVQQIFTGDIRDVSHIRNGANWNTLIHSGDGERAYRWSRINETFKAGTLVKDALHSVVKSMGVNKGNVDAVLDTMTAQYVNGIALHGSSQVELDRILRAQGYEWSIQDGALQVLKTEQTTSILIPDIGPDSGLIGSPEFGADEKTKGPKLKAKCLLEPRVHVGGRVHLTSERFNGDVRITELEHTGDTISGEWCTSFEGEPL